jgi:hypothetical protein
MRVDTPGGRARALSREQRRPVLGVCGAGMMSEALDRRAGAGGGDGVALAFVECNGFVERLGSVLGAPRSLQRVGEVDERIAA